VARASRRAAVKYLKEKSENQGPEKTESPVEFKPFMQALLVAAHLFLLPLIVFVVRDCSTSRSAVSYGINGDPADRIAPKLVYSRIQLLEDSTTNVTTSGQGTGGK
jgi:hypothetical protein